MSSHSAMGQRGSEREHSTAAGSEAAQAAEHRETPKNSVSDHQDLAESRVSELGRLTSLTTDEESGAPDVGLIIGLGTGASLYVGELSEKSAGTSQDPGRWRIALHKGDGFLVAGVVTDQFCAEELANHVLAAINASRAEAAQSELEKVKAERDKWRGEFFDERSARMAANNREARLEEDLARAREGTQEAAQLHEADLRWLERQTDNGHCGESTSEAIQRRRINACIERITGALRRAAEVHASLSEKGE